MGELADFDREWGGRQEMGGTLRFNVCKVAGMVISAGQLVRQVSIGTDSIVPVQNKTFPQKNFPNL